MSTDDASKWDAIWEDLVFDRVPGPKSVFPDIDAVLPRSGRAIDVAGGAGANAVWMARRGLDVTLVDVSTVALGHGRRMAEMAGVSIETVHADLETDRIPAGPWDVLSCVYYIDRRLYPLYPYLLAPEGVLVLCHPTVTNLERHPRPSARYLLAPGELGELVPTLDIVYYCEGWTDEGFHEAQLVARRSGW